MTVLQRKQLDDLIDTLLDTALPEAEAWLQALYRDNRNGVGTPYQPVPLGGLW